MELEIRVSHSGDVIAGMWGSVRTDTLIDKNGQESRHSSSEGWPLCFLSEKYYRGR